MSTRISLLLSLMIVIAVGVYIAIVYPHLPDRIPIHWNIEGRADGWSVKGQGVAMQFGLLVGVWLLMLALPWLSPKKFEIETFRPTYNYIVVIMVALIAFINVVSIQQAFRGFDLGRVLVGGLMLFLAALGNMLGKVRRNFFVGVRTPWTLASESNWVATHRLAARLMVGAGVLGAILVFAGAPLAAVFIAFIAALLYPALYSFVLYKRTEGQEPGSGASVAVFALLLLSANAHGAEGREVEFKGAGGFVLKGTLLVPDGKKKYPAILMMPGSGPTDRNGNQPGSKTDILKEIAEALARNGIASLRFDKRAVATTYIAAYPKKLSAMNDFFTWENQTDDAQKALDFLRSAPQVDPKKVAVLGHSEGGMTAMELASRPDGPQATVLVGTPGRRLSLVARNQIEDGLARNPGSGVDAKKLLAEYDAAMKSLEETGNVPTLSPQLQPLFPAYASRYIRSMFTFNPSLVAPQMRGPVLVVQGEKDIQILVGKDLPLLLKALRSRLGQSTASYIVPNASHNLKAVKNENVEPGVIGPVAPAAIGQIVEWLKKTLG